MRLFGQPYIVTRVMHLFLIELGRQRPGLNLVYATPGHHIATEAKGEGAHQSRGWLQLIARWAQDRLATAGHEISSMVVSFA
jgi:hypothetical protein